ncbi:MAG: hypothetical protein ACRD4R_00875 [Candidatus Acidiferrales bacterium]
MISIREIWRRLNCKLASAKLQGAAAPAGAAWQSSTPRWKTRYASGLEVALARAREKTAWLGDEVARQRAEADRLRAEYARVRVENRALLNSILGIAGIPPISVASQNAGATEMAAMNSQGVPAHTRALGLQEEVPRSTPSTQPGPEAPAMGPVSPFIGTANEDTQTQTESSNRPRARANATAKHGKTLSKVTAPMRRRSWQQINRTLEFEAARKKSGRDAEGLDA